MRKPPAGLGNRCFIAPNPQPGRGRGRCRGCGMTRAAPPCFCSRARVLPHSPPRSTRSLGHLRPHQYAERLERPEEPRTSSPTARFVVIANTLVERTPSIAPGRLLSVVCFAHGNRRTLLHLLYVTRMPLPHAVTAVPRTVISGPRSAIHGLMLTLPLNARFSLK
jgi:hypothetical protein